MYAVAISGERESRRGAANNPLIFLYLSMGASDCLLAHLLFAFHSSLID